LGTLDLYYREARRAGTADMEFMRSAANVAAMAIERNRALEQLQAVAYHDTLTGLPNRRLFTDLLEHYLSQTRRKQPVGALLLLDLDHFQVVNDSLGHLAGDRLLQSVAERLKECLRDSDTVARMGGDEFMVLLPDIGQAADAAKIAQKLLSVIARPFQLSGQELVVTASIGLSVYPLDGTDGETLIKNADAALYRVKEQGRNHYQFWTAEMNSRALERLTLESQLRRALEQHQFLLHYQPQVDLMTGEITGVESLVRWNHPERGLVSPALFIGVAEESGLIIPLGEWILQTACAQARRWADQGYPVRVGVNLSVRQFRQKGLIELVMGVLRDTGLEPRYLNLEITESLAMEDVNASIVVLKAFGKLGVQMSIDDFGTGYSSLAYLKQLPIHTLKIDRAFVGGIGRDADDTAIVTALLTMAQSLGLKVIAEGVETEAQLAFLRTRGCEGMQGYLFSPPVPAETIEQFLQEGKRLRL
jgi:diguanylate cyclase (GGDEF)-like protein